MKPYELKQSLLDRMEIEALIVKIQRLEKELAEKELTIRILQKDLMYERSNADTNRVH
jgi:predicted RNase H-like nuclease (RuvC/YqgF family)